jgi:hypothetical protein
MRLSQLSVIPSKKLEALREYRSLKKFIERYKKSLSLKREKYSESIEGELSYFLKSHIKTDQYLHYLNIDFQKRGLLIDNSKSTGILQTNDYLQMDLNDKKCNIPALLENQLNLINQPSIPNIGDVKKEALLPIKFIKDEEKLLKQPVSKKDNGKNLNYYLYNNFNLNNNLYDINLNIGYNIGNSKNSNIVICVGLNFGSVVGFTNDINRSQKFSSINGVIIFERLLYKNFSVSINPTINNFIYNSQGFDKYSANYLSNSKFNVYGKSIVSILTCLEYKFQKESQSGFRLGYNIGDNTFIISLVKLFQVKVTKPKTNPLNFTL